MRHLGTAPISLVKAMCISKQCLMLGWSGDGLRARDKDGKWERGLQDTPIPLVSFQLLDGMTVWPLVWVLAPDVWSSKSLDLTAIEMIAVAEN